MRHFFNGRQLHGAGSALQGMSAAKNIRKVDVADARGVQGAADRVQVLAMLDIERGEQLFANILHGAVCSRLFGRSHTIALDKGEELLGEVGQVGCRRFELARPRGGLLTRLSDILQRARDLFDSQLLLIGGSDDLLKGLHALLHSARNLRDGRLRGVGPFFAGSHAFDRFFGQHDGRIDPALDIARIDRTCDVASFA